MAVDDLLQLPSLQFSPFEKEIIGYLPASGYYEIFLNKSKQMHGIPETPIELFIPEIPRDGNFDVALAERGWIITLQTNMDAPDSIENAVQRIKCHMLALAFLPEPLRRVYFKGIFYWYNRNQTKS